MKIEKSGARAIELYAQQNKMNLANQSSNSRSYGEKEKERNENSTSRKDQKSFLNILNRALK
jgi:hypothetical protein